MSIDLRKIILAILCFLAMCAWLFSMTSCDTTKRAERRQDKILRTHPNVAMVAIRKVAPCNIVKLDTTILTMDTTVLVDCPDWTDTAFFNNIIIRKIKVPVTLPVKIVTVVKQIEDMSKVIEVTNNLEASAKENSKLTDQVQRRGKTILWLVVFLVGLSIPYIIKTIKYFTVPLSMIK